MPSVRQGRLRPGSLTGEFQLASFFNIFKPIHDLWLLVFYDPLQWLLDHVFNYVQGISAFELIGAYGIAIIALTILIRVLLAPLQQFQLVTQRRSMAEQRKLAPQVAELRKKFRKDPQKLNSEMMKLYQEHGVNPLGGLVGCLPLVVQLPILTALYYVFQSHAKNAHVPAHFLWLQNLNSNPNQHLLIHGLPIPDLAYLVFPLLAAVTTFVQSKMLQMPPPPNPTEQEQQTQQMQRTMVWLSPLMIAYFALNVPAGLGLYWFVGNCVSIIQQSFVVGWGNVLPPRFRTVAGGAPSPPSPPPGRKPASGPRDAPNNGSKRKKARPKDGKE